MAGYEQLQKELLDILKPFAKPGQILQTSLCITPFDEIVWKESLISKEISFIVFEQASVSTHICITYSQSRTDQETVFERIIRIDDKLLYPGDISSSGNDRLDRDEIAQLNLPQEFSLESRANNTLIDVLGI